MVLPFASAERPGSQQLKRGDRRPAKFQPRIHGLVVPLRVKPQGDGWITQTWRELCTEMISSKIRSGRKGFQSGKVRRKNMEERARGEGTPLCANPAGFECLTLFGA